MKTIKIDRNIKESDIAFIGVIVTVILYVMNVLGTGVIVGGDVGRISSGIPFYGFIAPFIFIAFAVFMARMTKKYSMTRAFIATYVTMLLPFVAYPFTYFFNGTPLMILPMYLCMPVGSLFYYLQDGICDLMNVPSYEANWLIFVLIAVLLIPVIAAPIVYRLTVSTES